MLLFSCAFPLINKADVLSPFCLLFLGYTAPLTKNPKEKRIDRSSPGKRDVTVKLLCGMNIVLWEETHFFFNGISKLKVNQMVKKNTYYSE